jgi:hypothetical protein
VKEGVAVAVASTVGEGLTVAEWVAVRVARGKTVIETATRSPL